MSFDVANDQHAIIRIQGMHCHRCEESIKNRLLEESGVHEVEVDFNSGQASVLFDRTQMTVGKLLEAINEVGYLTTSFIESAGGAEG